MNKMFLMVDKNTNICVYEKGKFKDLSVGSKDLTSGQVTAIKSSTYIETVLKELNTKPAIKEEPVEEEKPIIEEEKLKESEGLK
jgi:hypothetical protein